MRLDASDSPDSPLAPQSASISSMKIIEGAFSLAMENKLFTNFSDSPIHFDTKSDELTEKKVESASVATALAKYDFPVPGGPYNKNPDQAFRLPVKKLRELYW
jgi:hypothetical protein